MVTPIGIDWQGLLERASQGFFLMSAEGRLLFASPLVGQWVGMGKTHWDHWPAETNTLLHPPSDLPLGQARMARRRLGSDRSAPVAELLFLHLEDAVHSGNSLAILGFARLLTSAEASRPSCSTVSWGVAQAADARLADRLRLLREPDESVRSAGMLGDRLDLPMMGIAMRRLRRQLGLALGLPGDTVLESSGSVRIDSARLPIGVTLVGPKGVGKRTLARAIHARRSSQLERLVEWDAGQLGPIPVRDELSEVLTQRSSRGVPGACLIIQASRWPADLLEELAGRAEAGELRLMVTEEEPLARLAANGVIPSAWLHVASTLVLELPPLSERQEELPTMIALSLERLSKTMRRPLAIDEEAESILLARDWPGQWAELTAVLERAAKRSRDGVLRMADLPRRIRMGTGSDVSGSELELGEPRSLPGLDSVLERTERRLIQMALGQVGNNKAKAAERLGITRSRIVRRIRDLGIEPSG